MEKNYQKYILPIFIIIIAFSAILTSIYVFNYIPNVLASNLFLEDKNNLLTIGDMYRISTIQTLSLIIQVSATILAIVFTLSQFVLSKIADSYSIRLLKNQSPESRLYTVYVVIILTSLFFYMIYYLCPFYSTLGATLLLFGFVLSFIYLINYFEYVLRMISPLKYLKLIYKKSVNDICNQKENDLEDDIFIMGDITLKLALKDEEVVCLKYIDHFCKIFSKFIKIRNGSKIDEICSKNLFLRLLNEFELFLNSIFNRIPKTESNLDNILDHILDNYFRIFKESVLKNKEAISQKISENLFEILKKILETKDNDVLIHKLIKTEADSMSSGYYKFLNFAIKNNDEVRFELIRFLSDLISENNLDKISSNNLIVLLNDTLFKINKIIIRKDDFELFKKQIIYLSSSSIIKSPVKSLEIIIDDLKNIESERGELKLLINKIKYDLLKDFKKHDQISKEITSYNQINDNNKTRIKLEFNEFFIQLLFNRTFFVIGGYILFINNEKKFNFKKYISELWKNTNPQKNDFDKFNTKKPIEFDPFWIIKMYLFGGFGESNEKNLFSFSFNDFNETRYYIIQYLVLCLIKSITEYGLDLNIPTEYQIEEKEFGGMELNEWYIIANFFTSQKNLDELKIHVDDLKKNHKEWEDILAYSEEIESIFEAEEVDDENQIDSYRSETKKKKYISSKDAIIQLKEWIKSKTQDFNDFKLNFESIISIDEIKKLESIKIISDSYNKNSILPGIFDAEIFDATMTQTEPFTQVAWRPLTPKECFIKGLFSDCRLNFENIGQIIADGEINHFIKVILKTEVEPIEIKSYQISKKVKLLIDSLNPDGFKPDVLFIPSNLFIYLKAKNRDYITEDELGWILNYDDFEIRIILSQKRYEFDKIIIVDSSAVSWIYKNHNHGRIGVYINEFEGDRSLVDVCARTTVEVKVEDPEKVKIIEMINKRN